MIHQLNTRPRLRHQRSIFLACFLAIGLTSCASIKPPPLGRSAPEAARAVAVDEHAVPTKLARPAQTSSQSPIATKAAALPPDDSIAGGAHSDLPPAGKVASQPNDVIRLIQAEEFPAPDEPVPQREDLLDLSPPEAITPGDDPLDGMPQESRPVPEKEVSLSAPLEAGDMAHPINLATALRLSDARPLVVTAAQAGAWIAEAQLQRAELIWVPTLNMGADYIRHDGFGPDFNRGLNTAERPLNQNVNFLYAGMGLIAEFALTDAIFEPLAARQTLNSRRWDIQTAKNDALLATATAYFDVHESRGKYAGAVDVVQRTEKLVDRIGRLSEDLVPKVELARANRMLASAQQNAALKREKWRVSSASLTQVLRLDPRVVVDPAEPDHLQITLIDPARPLDDLIPTGLTNRPELSSQSALVDAVAERIRREKGRILMPSILLSGFQTPNELIQVGAQGFGADRKLDLWSVRSDFSPQVVWKLDAMGMGNLARIKEQRGEQSRAFVELFKAQDAVAADVTRSQAALQSAAARVVEAERSLHEAIITFDGNYEGLAQTKRFGDVLVQAFRPQEAVIAVDELIASYDQYFATVADYNRAQFQLYHAIGYPALELIERHPPGEVTPIDTSRPGYLPPVESGPPAATR